MVLESNTRSQRKGKLRISVTISVAFLLNDVEISSLKGFFFFVINFNGNQTGDGKFSFVKINVCCTLAIYTRKS